MYNHEVQNHFKVYNWGDMIEKDHICRDIILFIDKYFDTLDIKPKKFNGSSMYPLRSMLKVLVYAAQEGITDVRVIENLLKYNIVYKYVSGDITPSYSVINNFQRAYNDIIEEYNKLLLKEFKDEGLTNFTFESIDGTFIKSNNSRFNVIHKDDIETLINYYESGKITEDEVKKLRKPAYKMYKNEPKNVKERLKLLYTLKEEISKSKQNTVPINDSQSKWITNKKGNAEPGYCIQFAGDYEAKIITGIVVTDKTTDAHTFPEIADKCIENTGKKPDYFLADTAYHNLITYNHCQKNKYTVLTPTGTQTRKNRKKLNPKPYHKDHFTYDAEKDQFICPEGNPLYQKYEYPKYDENNELIKNIRVYRAEKCPQCPHQSECTPSTNKRTISENATEYQLKMNTLLDKEEYLKISKTRSSTIEPIIGAIKRYHLDELQITGTQRLQETFNYLMLGYNLKRKYRIKQEQNNDETSDKQTKLAT